MNMKSLLTKGKTLIIRADANSRIGIGHVMRCIALAQEWTKRNGQTVLVGNITAEAMRVTLKRFEISHVPLEQSYPNSAEDMKILLAEAHKASAGSWIALDGYFLDTAYQKAIRSEFKNTLVVDDYHHLYSYECSVLLNQNLDAENISYRINSDATILAGAKYAMLRNEFRTARATTRKRNSKGKTKILLSMGGADPHNTSLKVLEALVPLSDQISCTLVVGPANPYMDQLDNFRQRSNMDLEILTNVEKMSDLIAGHDLLLGAGGSSCWESCCIGTPLAIITTAENQLEIARALDRKGAALYLGDAATIENNEILTAIQELISNRTLLDSLAEKAAETIDGKGVSKIVDTLMGIE
ncbi:UDP-2,4-diacetamido-2,4,6-trideoxy-beta-L-altropyranose hydrolase [Maridesulfovibrio sp.]|uniref:UDP-2,4-diacetamido-2,4, 6-trideoxy-beta-L-altropyranose hydrolase n=1 Tax=Maridesulfovibrio sp. TaxID=2795000 RepID=UPI002A1871FF|nr:UDP-2,4-diacetamido-2,4,6-trideoxy-beta-L-altropyranose hydrolase [Maridesulfovibrio sp.]